MTAQDNSEIKNQLRVTNIIFFALISGMLLFFVIVTVLIQSNQNPNAEQIDKIFIFIVPIFGLMIMFLTRMIYNQMIAKFSSEVNLLQKIANYRTSKIVVWAMIEGACMFSLVATMLTSNYLYVVVFIFLFGFFILMRPSKESLVKDMRLNSEESDLIQRN